MKVCIDAGHGGKDPGATGYGMLEKDINLDIARELKPLLEVNGIQVVMTRTDDSFVELQTRCDIANRAKVDLFASIHANAGGGTGPEVLIIAPGGKAEAAANKILPYIVATGQWRNRGVKIQNVQVLRNTDMPAILTENGFVDNADDAAKLKSAAFRKSLAGAHARGICSFFGIAYKEVQARDKVAEARELIKQALILLQE